MGIGMSKSGDCKGCQASVQVKIDESYEKLRSTLADGSMAVSKEDFESRIAICKHCPSLQYDTTCKYCGCLVHARAIGRNSYCPEPLGDKWG